MLTLASFFVLAALGYVVAVYIFGIDEVDLHGMLILILITVGFFYRWVDRRPASCKKFKKQQGLETGRGTDAMAILERSEKKSPIKLFRRRQWEQFLDYYNVWRAVHEWKRERIARSLFEVVKAEHRYLNENERSKEELSDDVQRKISRDAYNTAERLLNAGRYMQSLESIERITRMECPKCKGTGFDKEHRRCDQCEANRTRTVPRFLKDDKN